MLATPSYGPKSHMPGMHVRNPCNSFRHPSKGATAAAASTAVEIDDHQQLQRRVNGPESAAAPEAAGGVFSFTKTWWPVFDVGTTGKHI